LQAQSHAVRSGRGAGGVVLARRSVVAAVDSAPRRAVDRRCGSPPQLHHRGGCRTQVRYLVTLIGRSLWSTPSPSGICLPSSSARASALAGSARMAVTATIASDTPTVPRILRSGRSQSGGPQTRCPSRAYRDDSEQTATSDWRHSSSREHGETDGGHLCRPVGQRRRRRPHWFRSPRSRRSEAIDMICVGRGPRRVSSSFTRRW
jgi:hypothetical protein